MSGNQLRTFVGLAAQTGWSTNAKTKSVRMFHAHIRCAGLNILAADIDSVSRCRRYSDGMVVRRLALKSSELLIPGVGVINSSVSGGTISAITCLVAPGLPSSVDCTANSDRTNREAR